MGHITNKTFYGNFLKLSFQMDINRINPSHYLQCIQHPFKVPTTLCFNFVPFVSYFQLFHVNNKIYLNSQNYFINIKFVDNCNPLKFQEIKFPSTYSETFLKNNLDEQFVFLF